MGNILAYNPLTGAAAYPVHMLVTTEHLAKRTITITSFNASVPEGLVIIAVYFIVTSILGLILFERKEFN